jgi:hypothetical protein
VLDLEHRLGRFEQQRIEAELAALPDPDSPARCVTATMAILSCMSRRTTSTKSSLRRCSLPSASMRPMTPGPAICRMSFSCRQRANAKRGRRSAAAKGLKGGVKLILVHSQPAG